MENAKLPAVRVGLGYDIHRTQAGRRLVLGGIEFASPFGLLGHSDADVVIHAVCDALLGAAALGDIGQHYADTDARWSGADSRRFLRETAARVRASGYDVVNVDVSILAQMPRIAPVRDEMRRVLADDLGVDVGSVSVKAGTNEGLDAVGRGEAIACHAIATLCAAG